MGLTLGKRLQLYHFQSVHHPRGDFCRRGFLHPQAEGDVFKHGHVREKRIALEYGIDVAVFRRNMGDILVFKVDTSDIDAFQTSD